MKEHGPTQQVQFGMGTMLADGLEFGYLQEVSVDFAFEEAVLHSGNTLWPVDVRVHGADITGNAAYANITAVIFEKLLGGTRTGGKVELAETSYPGDWQLSHQMTTDNRSFDMLLYKCRSSKLAINLSRETHVIPNFDFKVYADASQGGSIGYVDCEVWS